MALPDGSVVPLDRLRADGGGFEAARNDSKKRGFIVFPQLDTRLEINAENRTEVLRKSRWLYDNNPTAKRIIRAVARMLGWVSPQPVSPDPEWNEMAKRAWRHNTESPRQFDRAGKYGFRSYVLNLNRLWLKDGDSLTTWVTGERGNSQIRCFEGHQIGNPRGFTLGQVGGFGPRHPEDRWFDGVYVGAENEQRAYRLIHPDDHSRATVIPANKAHLYTMWERPGQTRGIGALHAAIPDMHDITEILSDVKVGIKGSNLLAFYLKATEPGAQLPGTKGLGRNLKKYLLEDADGDGEEGGEDDPDDDFYLYEEVFGGGMVPKWEGFEPGVLHDERPNRNQIELFNWLIRAICLSLDIPPELLWEIGGLNGNTARVMSEEAQEALDTMRMEVVVPFAQRCWFHVIGTEIAAGRLRLPKVPKGMENFVGWWSVEWIPPRRKSIDRGREGRLNLEERRAMLRTLHTHYSEIQKDWTSETRQWLDEVEFILNEAEGRNWPEERLAKLEAMLLAGPAGVAVAGEGDGKGEQEEREDTEKEDED